LSQIAARVGVIQRVLPAYRAAFFDALAAECAGGLSVFAGQPRLDEMIEEQPAGLRTAVRAEAENHHWFSGGAYLCWQGGLMRWLKEWQPQILVVEANPRYVRTPSAVRWMHRRGRGVIGWGLGLPHGGKGLAGWLRRRFLGQFDALVTYSQQGLREYRAAGIPAGKVFLAPNAVAGRPTLPIPPRLAAFEEAGPAVLFVGRLQARKRVDLLLRACAALPAGQQPRLWVVGDGPEREALEALAQTVYPQAQSFGARHGDELAPFFDTADVFVLPGTGGLAVQQAMSHGLPVMVAEADGTQADLVRPENGWALPPGDLQALTQTLRQALADPTALRRMGAASYRIVREEINLENMVAAFVRAVGSLQEK